MTQLFRSKSCVLGRSTMFDSVPPSPTLYLSNEEEEEEEEGYEEEDEEEERGCFMNPISTPLIVPRSGRESEKERNMREERQRYQFPILEILVEALRKSLVCTVGREDLCALDIGWPTDVQHVSHVTFDRFNGFLGLPVEFEPEIPMRVPSASASVFGVSAESMQCVYDRRGNSVPTILLMMQRRLYSERGLQAEGIFRINAENSQEEYVRGQLNRGVVPFGVDVHCLAGLIKAWFRELPTGVLDSLTPDQVMHCNTEEECTQLVSLLPPTESALLDWAINLMADVVEHEDHNKMNARNIAMVFAPNMTQMADPLTALLHAVQVMNLLKTLVMKILRERENSSPEVRSSSSCSESSSNKGNPNSSNSNSETGEGSSELAADVCPHDEPVMCTFQRSGSSHSRLESDAEDIFWSFKEKSTEDDDDHQEFITSGNDASVVKCDGTGYVDNDCSGGYNSCSREEVDQRFSDSTKSWRQGVRRLYKHPVFQLSKSMKKPADIGIVNNSSSSREGSGAATWV